MHAQCSINQTRDCIVDEILRPRDLHNCGQRTGPRYGLTIEPELSSVDGQVGIGRCPGCGRDVSSPDIRKPRNGTRRLGYDWRAIDRKHGGQNASSLQVVAASLIISIK